MFLVEATPAQLSDVVSGIAASVAVFQVCDNSEFMPLACNQQFFSMSGKAAVNFRHRELKLGDILPQYAQNNFLHQLSKCVSGLSGVEFEEPFDIGQNTYWWRCVMTPIVAPDMTVARVICTCVDITEKQLLKKDLDASRARLSAIVGGAYDGIVTIDAHHRIILFNDAAEQIFGFSREEVIGQSLSMLIPQGARARHEQYLEAFGQSPILSRSMNERSEVYGQRKDGSVFPAEITISKSDDRGNSEKSAIVRDISEKVQLIEQLRQEAENDQLTGIANRRTFMRALEAEITRSYRYHRPMSLICFDLDNFKQINDNYGHPVGDIVLEAVGSALNDTCRTLDVPARLGGEEFCVLLRETNKQDALRTAERIQQALAAITVEEAPDITVTASFGITGYNADDTVESVMRRADKLLYQSKANGKDCISSDDTAKA